MPRVSDAVEKAAQREMQEATTKRRQRAQFDRDEEKVDMYLSPTCQP